MKPSLDLDDSRVKIAIEFHHARMKKALNAPQRVENAVLPIYWTQKAPTKPEQVASGVAVRIKDEYFIFSASHVFDDIGVYRLLIGTGGGEKLAAFSGERFSSKKGPSNTHSDDPIDASVFHIQSGVTDPIKDVALSLDDFDFAHSDESKSAFLIAGFRVRKSRTEGDNANSKRECFPSIEYGENEYSIHGLNRDIHLALAYENQIIMDGKWQTSPSPKGMSGGAIIKVEGVSLRPLFSANQKSRQLLSAITIEQRREKGGKPGVLIGTRIGVHLALIDKYLPNLMRSDSLNEKSI